MQHDFTMRSKMSVIKSKMGNIKSKIGRKFEQKRKAKWVKEKANLVKAYSPDTTHACMDSILHMLVVQGCHKAYGTTELVSANSQCSKLLVAEVLVCFNIIYTSEVTHIELGTDRSASTATMCTLTPCSWRH